MESLKSFVTHFILITVSAQIGTGPDSVLRGGKNKMPAISLDYNCFKRKGFFCLVRFFISHFGDLYTLFLLVSLVCISILIY